jgi:hypothetical protein
MSESPPLVLGQKVWCPRCNEYVKIVRPAHAAKIVDVDRRTIYNYVKRNKVSTFRIAGGTLRICSHCLLRDGGKS